MYRLHRVWLVAVSSLMLAACAAALLHGASGGRGAPTSDAAITAGVQNRLAVEPGIDAGAVRVSSRDGIVTLEGRVPDTSTRQRAEQVARTVSGVRAVRNQLAVN